MPLVALVCAGLLGWADGPALAPDVAAGYQQARATASRTPGDQVRLALWCEAHGLTAERMRHLALALLADPTNATARGLSGLVARDGRWVAPDSVARSVRDDEGARALLADYDLRRSRAAYTADAQWALGLWADEQGLHDQARAHFTAVTRLDPAREIAWKRLGYKKHDGRWATDAQLAAEKTEADAQKQADRTWKPLLEKWRGMLDKPSRQAEARALLLGVTDPRALPSIAHVFGTNRASDQQVAVGLLGQIESPQASRGLAALAVFSSAADVRRTAVETLRHRDPRDFVGLWIALIRPLIKYEVKPVGGPGSPGTLFIVGQKANTRRVYKPIEAPDPAAYAGMTPTYGPDGLPVLVGSSASIGLGITDSEAVTIAFLSGRLPQNSSLPNLSMIHSEGELAAKVQAATHSSPRSINLNLNALTPSQGGRFLGSLPIFGASDGPLRPVIERDVQVPIGRMMLEADASARVAQDQIARDVATLDKQNGATHRANEPTLLALRDVTHQDFGEDQDRWNQWWINQQGYALANDSTTQPPTFVEEVPINFTPVATPTVTNQVVALYRVMHACFAAGTPVRTVEGTKAIETVRRGDLVLVEDTLSGALAYQPVLTAFHNPPSSTYRVKLGDDEVVATGIHRFWKAGKGWTMARDLVVGDSLRVLGGVATVAAVTHEQVQPVFNLEVAAGRSFFVGQVGALVHDNSPVEATPNPFDGAKLVVAATTVPAR